MPGAQKYQQRRTTGRKREILEAALACFAEQGLAATSIEHVRARAAASTGSIYHHFRDKDGLAAAVYRHVLAEYHADLLAKLDTFRTGRRLIEGIVEHLVGWVSSHREAARFLVEMRHADTVRGWYDSLPAERRAEVDAAIDAAGVREDEVWWSLIRLAYSSPAVVAMAQAQDVLGLGSEARMNRPGTLAGNWQWRLRPGQLTADVAERLAAMAATYDRT